MKKLLSFILIALSAFCALAEPAIYADQGGVRVFEDGGSVGLMDSQSNIILPAEYDEIMPFAGDYAVLKRGAKSGVVRKDGVLMIPCEFDRIELHAFQHLAVSTLFSENGEHTTRLFDLKTGETLYEGDRTCIVEGNFIYMSAGMNSFFYESPYHTDVCNLEGNIVFSQDVQFIRPFGEITEDYAVIQYNDGSYAIVNREWKTVVSGITDSTPEFAGGCIFYRSETEKPLTAFMESLNLSRERMMRGLKRYFGMEEEKADAATEFMLPVKKCGVILPDGSRIDVPGTDIRTLGRSEPPLCIKVNGWNFISDENDRYGYIDIFGQFVLPPIYRDAYPFVDGAAVVREGDAWRLIDETGAQVGDIEWTWGDQDMWEMNVLAMQVIPVRTEAGYRLIDRRGEFVTDEVFSQAGRTLGDNHLMLTDREGRTCVIDSCGKECFRVNSDDFIWFSAEPDAVWFRVDGLLGLMGLDGNWIIEPFAERIDRVGNETYSAALTDGKTVYMDRAARHLAPAPDMSYDIW
ncbi:MAG: WG repeat-containing protein [Clostridia bacterium]|nr:WG repeat-containing protein [Clostridia bacterium]